MSQLMKPSSLIFVKFRQENVEFYQVASFEGDLLAVYVWVCMSQKGFLIYPSSSLEHAGVHVHTDFYAQAPLAEEYSNKTD